MPDIKLIGCAIVLVLMLICPKLIALIVLVPSLIVPFFLFGMRKKPDKVYKKSPYLHPTEGEIAEYSNGPYSTTDKEECLPIRFAAEGAGSNKIVQATTIGELLTKAANRRPNKPALRVERPTPPLEGRRAPKPFPLEDWKMWTWKQYSDECKIVAKAFINLGLEPFDGVSIFGFNSPEWFMGEIGCILAGGIAAGIYPSDTPDQVAYKARHSKSVIAVVENNKKADLFLKAFQDGKIPDLKAIVVWTPPSDAPDKLTVEVPEQIKLVHWSDLEKIAANITDSTLETRMNGQKPNNVCCYIYTSGTTGKPKAVMITHDNIIWEAAAINHIFKDQKVMSCKEEEERIISYLPLSHVAGMMVDIIFPLYCTATQPAWMSANFARPYDLKVGSLADRLRSVRPTMFLGVPRVWEKIAEKMKSVGAKTKGLKLKVASFSKNQGLMHRQACQMGGSGSYPLLHPVGALLLNKIKATLGLDQCKYGLTGAAPIQKETLEYFASLGIQINECYGMSECCGAITASSDQAHVWGSCGWTLPGGQVKIFKCDGDINEKKECPLADDLFSPTEEQQGEICFRGRNIMPGYMANPEIEGNVETMKKKNAGAIDNDGWLHSGDKGCMDKRGMVKITGRYKELIIGAGGENIAPVPIENNWKLICPGISNVMMLGDKKKFNVCLVTLKAVGATGEKPGGDELDDAALAISPGVKTISAAMRDEKWIQTLKKVMADTNKNGDVCPSRACKIQKFSILPLDFSVETTELTPTLKLKRSVVQNMHKELVDRMYSSKDNYIPFHVATGYGTIPSN